MKVLILAGGYGTRLQSLGLNQPKGLLPINGRPLVNYIIDKIDKLSGLKEVWLVSNARFYQDFLTWAKQQRHFSYTIRVFNDGTKSPEERLGSIGDIAFVLKETPVDDDLLVIGGDNLFDYHLDAYVAFAREKSAVTIGLYDIGDLKEATKFGVVAMDEAGRIISFEEKPQQPKSTLIAMCCYYLPKGSLGLITRYLKESGKNDTAGDYIYWLSKQHEVYGFKFVGKWYDIGSVESYQEAQKAFKE